MEIKYKSKSLVKKGIIVFVVFLICYFTFLGARLFYQIGAHIDFYRMNRNLNLFQLSIWIACILLVIVSVYYRIKFRNPLFFKFTYIFLILAFGIFALLNHFVSNIYISGVTRNDLFSLGLFSATYQLVAALVLTIFTNIGVRIYITR